MSTFWYWVWQSVIISSLFLSAAFMPLHSNMGWALLPLMLLFTALKLQITRHVKSIKEWHSMDNNTNNSDKYQFFPWGKAPQTHMDAPFCYRSTIILNIWMYGCSKQVFPFDGPYSSSSLCCSQLAGLSVVTTSPFNAPDRGLFAPIYVFSPITPWQAGGCQATLLRWWWSPLWLVLPASCTIFFIFLDSIREKDSLICLSLVQSVV